MEKFGRNIRKLAGVVGLSALSMLSESKAQDAKQQADNIDYDFKNKIEWTRSELGSNKSSTEGLARFLAEEIFSKKEEYKKNTEEIISSLNEALEFLSKKSLTPENLERKKDLGEKLKKYQKGLEDLEKLEKQKEVPRALIEEKINDIKKIVSYYDIGRQWVLDNLKDPVYAERFKEENEKSFPDMPAIKLEEYIKKMSSLREKQASDSKFLISKDINSSSSDKNRNLEAFYNLDNDKIYLPINNNDSLRAINNVIHEYSHKITKANEFLSEKAIELFLEAFDNSSTVSHFRFTNSGDASRVINYFSDPTEMYARKKVFEYDLERLGVKKYGEEFTIEHYKKVLELKNKGKLNKGSDEFLYIIKPTMIRKVMNEIANINSIQKKNENLV